MFLRSGALAAFLSLLSASAFSAVLTVDFKAHITSLTGNGMGYKIGDSISGNYVIDVSKAEGQWVDPTNTSYTGSDSSGLVSSSFAGSPGGYLDIVSVTHDNPVMPDHLSIMKAIGLHNGFFDSSGSTFSFSGVNWLHDLKLNNINFYSDNTALLANSGGGFLRWDTNYWIPLEGADFTFDSVKMVSSSVPEPAIGALLVLGLLSVGARRRLHATK